MKMTDFFLAQLEREAVGTRRALERVPEGQPDWKPHEKSMPLGYLSQLVATMPSWIGLAITQNELDLKPLGGATFRPPATDTNPKLLQAFEDAVAAARLALENTSDGHLATPWRLLVAGQVVMENPRYVVIADTFTHQAHHRECAHLYLRLNGVPVPAIYGPSADDQRF